MADSETAAPAAEHATPVDGATTANGSAKPEQETATTETSTGEVKEEANADKTASEEKPDAASTAAKRKAADGDDTESKRPQKLPRQQQRTEYNKNVKTDYTQLEESSDPEEIRKQVEFYFSDSNLPMDNYLYNLVGGSENKQVPVKVIHSFKRMKRFQPYSAVIAALKDSEILEVSGDAGKEEVKRKTPLEERGDKTEEQYYKAFEDKTMPRSVYAKGFGDEGPSTQLDLEEFFEPYGPVNSVRMRRTYPEKVFKGSVFVEFDNESLQQAFLALDPKPKFQDKDLLIMSKKEYVDMKSEDIRQGKIKPNEGRPGYNHRQGGRNSRGGHGDRGRGRGRDGGRGGRDRDDWRGRRDDFQKGGKDRGGRRGRDDDGVMKCYNCGEPGHRKNDCPKGRGEDGGSANKSEGAEKVAA